MPEQQTASQPGLNKEQRIQKQLDEQLKKSIQKSNEIVIGMKKQLRAQNQNIKNHQDQKRKKVSRVYKKSLKNKYASMQQIYEEQQELEVPVDGELERGSKIFMMHCSSCHSLDAVTKKNMRGPSLGLIFNRRVASDPNYQGYTEAAIKSQKFWTAKSLYRFMYSPKNFIEGTICNILKGEGLKSEEDRADIIEFLRGYSEQLSKNIRIKEVRSKGYGQVQTQLYTEEEISKKRNI